MAQDNEKQQMENSREPACEPVCEASCEPACEPVYEASCEPACEPDCVPSCEAAYEASCESECEPSCSCSGKTKERSQKEYKDLMNRLKRIEGQVRGIQGMLEKDSYCTDVLTQVAAVNAALNSFSKALLANHIHSCVAENIRAGNDEVIDELVILLEKLMK